MSAKNEDWRKWLKFSCTGCGNCCKGTIVLITGGDVRRIMDATGMPARDFVHFFSNVEMSKRDSLWIRLGNRRVAMGLKWKWDQSPRRCMFLGDDNMCGIYEHRPVTCRSHPFEIKTDDNWGVTKLGISEVVDCPHEWDGEHTLRELKSTERWNCNQVDAFESKVKEWNRKRSGKRTAREFLRFVGLEN
jgi:Fe-S-cluster containining protein